MFNYALVLCKLGKLLSDVNYFTNSVEVIKTLENNKCDYRTLFLRGSVLSEASKLSSLSHKDRMAFAMQSKESLVESVEISNRQVFACLYCLGHVNLQLVRMMGNEQQHDLNKIAALLRETGFV